MKIIVATDINGGIAKDGKIPWHCQEDQAFFRLLTIGDKVAMGMNTFNSIKKPLSSRYSLVITRDESLLWSDKYAYNQDYGFYTIESAFYEADWIIGGEQIYNQAISKFSDLVDQIYISRIDVDAQCDQFFLVPNQYKLMAKLKLSDSCFVQKYIRKY